MQEDIQIAGTIRTPIGRFGGALASQTAVDLGCVAATAALARAGVAAEQVDQTIFGHARQAGCGPNPARQVAIRSGIPVERPAFTINQACLSGMQAVFAAARAIRCGEAEVVLAGGMEAMSRVPYLIEGRWGFRMGHQEVVDAMYRDGFRDPLCGKLMGETAETLATRYEISREEQDAYAVETQRRCQTARDAGHFSGEIAPVTFSTRRGEVTVDHDEHPRDDVQLDSLARLRPVFASDGTVTAGNSSGITDGAAAMLVMSASAAKRLGVSAEATIGGWTVVGVDPEIMGIGPVPAVRRLMERTGSDLDTVDLIELNEAFAAQVLAVDRDLKFDRERLNVNGGSIALGHPIGCSGARIIVTLVHELRRRGQHRGLATLCVSGGMGGALLLDATGGGAA